MATHKTDRQIDQGPALRGWRWAFGLLMVVFVLLSASILFLVTDTQNRLRDSTYDRGGLSGIQIQTHFERLMRALADFAPETSRASTDKIVLEFDILYERVAAHPTRPPNDRFGDPEFLALIAKVKAALDQQVLAIDRASAGDLAGLTGLRDTLRPLRADIERLASRTTQLASELRDSVRQSNVSRADHVLWLIFGLAFLSLMFLLTIWVQFTRTEKQRIELLELAANLRQATINAEEASRAKTEFLAHMSHELRTPLNSILGFSEVIRDGVMGDCRPAIYAEYAGNINDSSQHLLGLINGLLDLSRIDVKKLDLEEEEIELGPLIESVLTLIQANAARHGITIDARRAASGVTVRADARRLRQMLLNLLDNAIKFSDDGTEIQVSSLLRENGELAISVSDRGRGIPESELETVLEPFHRGDTGIYQATAGVGLGLSIVQSLITLHGGSLRIESNVGEGTIVQILLPASRVRLPEASPSRG